MGRYETDYGQLGCKEDESRRGCGKKNRRERMCSFDAMDDLSAKCLIRVRRYDSCLRVVQFTRVKEFKRSVQELMILNLLE
jgi:hypothetical protein